MSIGASPFHKEIGNAAEKSAAFLLPSERGKRKQ